MAEYAPPSRKEGRCCLQKTSLDRIPAKIQYHPVPNLWIECGNPAGKYQRSPLPTSPRNTVPSGLRQVTRAFPYSIMAHSSAVCQCSSRKLPAVSRILTPAMSFEEGRTLFVTWLVQPPSSTRL